jgi:hypothetical protein
VPGPGLNLHCHTHTHTHTHKTYGEKAPQSHPLTTVNNTPSSGWSPTERYLCLNHSRHPEGPPRPNKTKMTLRTSVFKARWVSSSEVTRHLRRPRSCSAPSAEKRKYLSWLLYGWFLKLGQFKNYTEGCLI